MKKNCSIQIYYYLIKEEKINYFTFIFFYKIIKNLIEKKIQKIFQRGIFFFFFSRKFFFSFPKN
jgi:hypothetical protein